jgi:hypothetical protein
MPLSREDRWLTRWLLLTLALAVLLIGVNALGCRYTGILYYPGRFLPLTLIALPVAYCSRWQGWASPRALFFVRSWALYALAVSAPWALLNGVQFTPFAPIDLLLQRWDRALGVDVAAVLHWTAARPALRSGLEKCYDSTNYQLMFAPLVAGLAQDRRRMRVFLYAIVYSSLLGFLFYYFFPSSGPAAVFASPDFVSIQRATSMKFYQVHHFLKVTTMQGGMIAFPSFHVAWSVLVTYAALPCKRVFYPLAVLNFMAVASTVLLGWHFLVDVPAGIALAAVSLIAAAKSDDRLAGRMAA